MTADVILGMKSFGFFDGFALIGRGRRAVKDIKGLRKAFWKGLIINFIIFALLAITLNLVLYLFALRPLVDRFFGGEGWLGVTGTVVLWVVQLGLAALFALVSLHASIALMGMWYEDLVAKTIAHFRPIEQRPFTLKTWIAGIWDGVVIALKDLLILILIFPLGFTPVVGGGIVFFGGAWIIGRSVISPYLTVSTGGRVRQQLKHYRLTAIKLGWLHGLLAMIPVVGWVLMPVAVTDQLIGLTHAIESMNQLDEECEDEAQEGQ